MKNIIILIIPTALLSFCKQTNTKDAVSTSINNYMLKNVDDPATYENVETILTDSLMVNKITYDAKNILFKNGHKDMDFISYAEEMYYIKDSLKKAGHDSIIKVVGYYFYEHKYRVKKHGEKTLKVMHFVFDDKKDKLINASSEQNYQFKDEKMY